MTSTSSYMAAAAGLSVPPTSAGIRWPCLDVSSNAPAGPPERRRSAVSGGKITAMQSDWATIEINGAQHIIHRRPSPANFVLPWRLRAP